MGERLEQVLEHARDRTALLPRCAISTTRSPTACTRACSVGDAMSDRRDGRRARRQAEPGRSRESTPAGRGEETGLDPAPHRLHEAAQEERLHRVRGRDRRAAHPVVAADRAEDHRRRRDHASREPRAGQAARAVARADDRDGRRSRSCSRTSGGSAAVASRSTCSTTCAPRCSVSSSASTSPSHDELQTGQLVSRASSDVALLQGFLQFMPIGVANILLFIVSFGAMLWLSPLLSLVMLAVAPAAARHRDAACARRCSPRAGTRSRRPATSPTSSRKTSPACAS